MGGFADAYCAFHTRNPVTGKLAQCMSAPVAEVIVGATTPDARFYGVGVQAAVCAEHKQQLMETYGALPVPERDEA